MKNKELFEQGKTFRVKGEHPHRWYYYNFAFGRIMDKETNFEYAMTIRLFELGFTCIILHFGRPMQEMCLFSDMEFKE